MKTAVTGLLVTLGLAASAVAVGVGPADASGATGIYRNCTALHTRYTHGLGRNGAHDHTSGTPVRSFYRSTKRYNVAMSHNRRLDADKDGIACEQR